MKNFLAAFSDKIPPGKLIIVNNKMVPEKPDPDEFVFFRTHHDIEEGIMDLRKFMELAPAQQMQVENERDEGQPEPEPGAAGSFRL